MSKTCSSLFSASQKKHWCIRCFEVHHILRLAVIMGTFSWGQFQGGSPFGTEGTRVNGKLVDDVLSFFLEGETWLCNVCPTENPSLKRMSMCLVGKKPVVILDVAKNHHYSVGDFSPFLSVDEIPIYFDSMPIDVSEIFKRNPYFWGFVVG